MAAAQRVSVTTSATQLDVSASGGRRSLLARNRGTSAVYLGGAAVTSATGYQVDPGEAVTWDSETGPGQAMFAVTASGSVSVHVIQVG